MPNNKQAVFRAILTEFVKSHNEYAGKVMEFADHLDQAVEIAQSLPMDIQMQLKEFLCGAMAARGMFSIFFGR